MPDTTTCSGLLILNWDGTVDLDLGTGWGTSGGWERGASLFVTTPRVALLYKDPLCRYSTVLCIIKYLELLEGMWVATT